ncbi:serine/arginine repetitive matrix protein 2 [Drosophila tropicalis]|uniref:serine/arginine repetitive matrix protein 2 n=1 Tax=Drosophila tropicalis TaxID=46794 RepID=UPI0035AC2595
MDKHNRYMTKDAGRSIVLERQERISIEGNSHMLIKNTQTQVRELYRRDNRDSGHSLEPKKSSSLSDTRIMATRVQVDSLNKQIENEIGRLKYFRDYFLRPEEAKAAAAAAGGPNTTIASFQQQRQQINQTRRQNLNVTLNNNNNTTIDEAQIQDTNLTLSLKSPGATPRPEVTSRPRFRTLGVKRLSKQEKEMMDNMETTDAEVDSDEVSRERISGGCTFDHCSVYQHDYAQSGISPHLVLPVSSPLTSPSHYHGTNRCCCCVCQQGVTAGSSSPVSFQYSTRGSPYPHQSSLVPASAPVAAPQHYPNVQPYCMYSSPHPNYSRRVTDLNTEDFCRHWCRNILDSRSESHDRSSRTTTTRGSTRATTPRSRSVSRSPHTGKFDYHLKNKLKEAGVSDSSSLVHYKVQDYEKITKVTLRKQSPAVHHRMTKRSDNEQMLIKDYVPAKTHADGKDPATNKSKSGTYNKYLNVYEKDHHRSLESSSPLDSPNVESTPTYTKIQERSPTPTIRTYGPTKGQPPTQSKESRSSRDSSNSSKLPLSTRRPAYQSHQSGYKGPAKMDDTTLDSAQRTKNVSPSIPSAPKQEYRQSIDKTSKVQSESESTQRTKGIPSPYAPKQEHRQSIDKTSKVQSESESTQRAKRLPSPTGRQEYRQSIDKTSRLQSESDSAQRTKRLPTPTGRQEYRQSIDKTSKVQSESESTQRTKRLPSPTGRQEYRQSIDKTSKVQSESESAQRTKRLPSPTGRQEYRQSIDKTSKVQSESESTQRTKRLPSPTGRQEYRQSIDKTSKVQSESESTQRTKRPPSPTGRQEYRQSIDKTSKVQSESESAQRTKRLPSPTGRQEYRQSIDKTSKVQSESESTQRTKGIPSPSAPKQKYRQSIDKTYNAHSESDSSQRIKRVPSPTPSAAHQEYRSSIDKVHGLNPQDLAGQRSRNEVVPKEHPSDQRLQDDQNNGKKEKDTMEPKTKTDQKEIRSLDKEMEESTKLIENQPNAASTSAGYKSRIKETSPNALIDQHDNQPSQRSRDNTSNESMRKGTSPSRPDYSQNKRDSYDNSREMQPPVFERSRDKDSDSGFGRFSDSGNQPQTNYNRQPTAQIKTDPSDGRWGIDGGHRLSLASKQISGIPQKRMNLAEGEVASTTSICRTWSQRKVSIKSPEQEGGPYLRRETQRYNKECVRYITTDIGPDAKISQASIKSREFSFSTQGTQTLNKKPSMSDLDSPYAHQDGRLSGTITPTIPKKLEERLTQTEILSLEERPTQTELPEANREERRTQTEPNERHERLTQTDLLTRDRHERLTQTELQEIPQNEAKDQTTKGHLKEVSSSPKNVSGDKFGYSGSTPQKRNLQSSASPRQSKQIEEAQIYQPPRAQQTKDSNASNRQQAKPEQSPLQSPQRRASISYYNKNGPASSTKGQKPLPTASTQNQHPSFRNSSQYGEERAGYSQADYQAKSRHLANHGVHQVPTQHDLTSKQPRAVTQSQLERSRNGFGAYIADPKEIICQQYDEDLQSGEITYKQAVPGSNRYPNDQNSSNRSRCDQLNYARQSRESPANPMQRSKPQSYVNSYEWCGGATYEKHANTERCTTFSRSAMQRSIDSNEGILPSETGEPCYSYIDDDDNYNERQQMGPTSQAPSSSCYQQQPQQAYNPQEEDIYSQYHKPNSDQDNVIPMPISAYTRHSRHHQHQDVADLRRAQGMPRDSCLNTNKCVADKRSRTVKFNDQNDQICPVERQRSSIDWEKAYQSGLLLDKMHVAQLNEPPADDEDVSETCRSSSSNNTDVTCVDSTCEDEYVTCDEELSDDFLKNLPPFQGCPCMLQTYINLASIRSDNTCFTTH